MKVSVVSCKTCKRAIAACNITEGIPASWYKSLGQYAAAGIWEITELNQDGFGFDGTPKNPCCGKRPNS